MWTSRTLPGGPGARFESTIRLDHSHRDLRDLDIAESARTYPFVYGAEELPELAHLIKRRCRPGTPVERWARTFLRNDRPIDTSGFWATSPTASTNFKYTRRLERASGSDGDAHARKRELS